MVALRATTEDKGPNKAMVAVLTVEGHQHQKEGLLVQNSVPKREAVPLEARKWENYLDGKGDLADKEEMSVVVEALEVGRNLQQPRLM